MKTEAYLFMEGRAEEAIDFYVRALGARLEMKMRYDEAPEPPKDGACAGMEGMPMPAGDKIMHASLWVGSTRVMISDGMCSGQPEFKGVGLALSTTDKAESERLFAALGDGGQVHVPLAPSFFSPAFGMVADRFGVLWMVVTEPAA